MIKMFLYSSNTDLTTRKEGINEGGEEIIRFTKPGQEKVNQNNPMFGQLPVPHGDDSMDLNSQVIKVYRGDHTSRFFVLTKVRILILKILFFNERNHIEMFTLSNYSFNRIPVLGK